jgi:hypothetical protein
MKGAPRVPVENIRTERIGPAQAEKYLEKNTRNRKLSSLVVSKYADLMRKGEWHFDGSPVRFDTDGNVIDGQHRLWAVIESDTTQRFLVIDGLGKDTFATIDTGKSRSFGDILSIDHPNLSSINQVAAATQMIYRWEQGLRGKALAPSGRGMSGSVPYRLLMEFFDANKERIIEVTKLGQNMNKATRGMTASVYALLAWVFDDISKEDSEFFFDRLRDGIGLHDGHAVLALRNSLQRFVNQSGDTRKTLPHDTAIAFGIKAWNYFRAGDEVKLITYRPGGANPEAFPIPR